MSAAQQVAPAANMPRRAWVGTVGAFPDLTEQQNQTDQCAMSETGQNAKYSSRADVFRSTPESGLKSDIAP
jgi:hypothetical protein